MAGSLFQYVGWQCAGGAQQWVLVSRVHQFMGRLWIPFGVSHMLTLQLCFFTYAAANRFLSCRGTGSLPVLVGASFAVQKGDPFAHRMKIDHLAQSHSISFPIGLAFWRTVPLCSLLFSFLGLLQVLICVFLFSQFIPCPFCALLHISLCSIQCHKFQQCILRRTLCWQSEWPAPTASLVSSIPYAFAIAKANVSLMNHDESIQTRSWSGKRCFFASWLSVWSWFFAGLLMEFDQGMTAAAPQKRPWASVVMPSSCLKNFTRAITRLGRGYLDLATNMSSWNLGCETGSLPIIN